MNFGVALSNMKDGMRVKRKDWEGYWFITENGQISGSVKLNPVIIAKLKDGKGYCPATPYQEDLLADDWEVVDWI